MKNKNKINRRMPCNGASMVTILWEELDSLLNKQKPSYTEISSMRGPSVVPTQNVDCTKYY